MKNINYISGFLLLFLGVLLSSCGTRPQPIDYGNDVCHYCQMTIVDQIYGAEIVTDKGKIFKFDAAECLIRHKSELSDVEGYQFLTNYFEAPGKFITLSEAKFLISENLPSPMGANLTAFKTDEEIITVSENKGGDIYNWNDVEKHVLK